MGLKRVIHDWETFTFTFHYAIYDWEMPDTYLFWASRWNFLVSLVISPLLKTQIRIWQRMDTCICIWASLIAQLVKNPPAMKGTPLDSWVGKICWKRDRLPTPVFLGFPGGSAGKESACNVGDLGLIPGLGRSPGEGKGYPLQCSDLENSMDCTAHRAWLRDFHF